MPSLQFKRRLGASAVTATGRIGDGFTVVDLGDQMFGLSGWRVYATSNPMPETWGSSRATMKLPYD
jgi:hypothetical protein